MVKIESEQQLLEDLNDFQREAVTYCDGPQLVIAGAGSGKTRVLTYKIAWLLMHYGMKPWNILALTFTNKAAKEMKTRIGNLVGHTEAQALQMGTFHSVFARILRIESEICGFNSNYTIYDESDARSLIKSICKGMGLSDKTYKPAAIHSAISMAKNKLCMPSDYANDGDLRARDRSRNMPEIFKIYEAYQQRLRQANAMDFDDLLLQTYFLFFEHEDIRRKYAERFQYVLVDEYQDTNAVQQQIITLLTREKGNICVVGDDYQSIYAFRGAKIDNILNFSIIYPTAKLFKLERNYRSTRLIVAAANSLMKHNANQIPKEVYSEKEEGEKVTILETISDKREAAMVCREIKRLKKEEGLLWSDFAILYRTNAQSRTFEEEMRKPDVGMGNHYRIFGGLSFYQRKEIKDIIAYFRLVINHDDEEAFRRIINYPGRGIGDTTVNKIAEAALLHGVSLWEVVGNAEQYGLNVNRGTMNKLGGFFQLIENFTQKASNTDVVTLGREIIKLSGIEADLATDMTPEGESRRENVESLISGMADFVLTQQEEDHSDHVGLVDYLSTVSLMTDADNDTDDDDKLTLMTIHSAKGLEFPVVFIVGLEENIFPSQRAIGQAKDMEEERRLLYVAITRAEKHCYLTWAHTRWLFGKMDGFVNPSRFIHDIDPKLLVTYAEGSHYESSERPEYEGRRVWEADYEHNRPYSGTSSWGGGYRRTSAHVQNSRPVADRFMADPQPKVTPRHRPEEAVNPFSPSFETRLKKEGRWKNVSRAMMNGGRQQSSSISGTPISGGANGANAVRAGQIIEHHRFGRGRVLNVEGTGENCKATVEFDTTGTKQLLLKFARFKVVE